MPLIQLIHSSCLKMDVGWPAGLAWQAMKGSGRDREKLVPTSPRHKWRIERYSSLLLLIKSFEDKCLKDGLTFSQVNDLVWRRTL